MKRSLLMGTVLVALLAVALVWAGEAKQATKKAADWAMNATIIEACSCPMFCQCYFNTKPAEHMSGHGHEGHGGGGEHFCRFNNAFKVNKGSHGAVKLDGAKFWVAGDLGDDFADAEMEWAVITFDKSMTQDQRDAVAAILGQLYPVKWKSMQTAEGEIAWSAGKGEARAAINGGKTAEVVLKAAASADNPAEPIVIKNLKYWGAPKNDGFILMPNVVQAYRTGAKPFEFKGTNGFMITVDISSKTVPGSGAAGS